MANTAHSRAAKLRTIGADHLCAPLVQGNSALPRRNVGPTGTDAEVFGVLQHATGDALVEEILLFPADPITGRRGTPSDAWRRAGGALVFAYQHQVVVTAAGPEDRP